jgi:putative RNA 2'-phosphotransferase
MATMGKSRTADEAVSRRLSYVLRHDPSSIGVALDDAGWVDVEALLAGLDRNGLSLTRPELEAVVERSDKQRFRLSVDRTRIRASQGHSVDVELGLEPARPPDQLFHGTVEAALSSIRTQGLVRRARHHVHLSEDRETAVRVGARRGRPVVLTVDAAQLDADGAQFFRSDNGVWLVDHVPPERLSTENGPLVSPRWGLVRPRAR